MRVGHISAAFLAWNAYKAYGVLPASGGLLDQPLWFLNHCLALDTVYEARSAMRQKDADMNKLTDEQLRMLGWLDKDADDG